MRLRRLRKRHPAARFLEHSCPMEVSPINDRLTRTSPATRLLAVLLLTGYVGLSPGCARKMYRATDQPPRGRLILLPGIHSQAWYLSRTVRGLRERGLQWEIEVIEWGGRFPIALDNLMNLAKNKKRAMQIAATIAKYRAERPTEPITLVGYSGGGGLALLVTETLPPDVNLDRLILIAAAISPRRDLTTAMAHTEHGVVNLYSRRDRLVLGAGTGLFGTIDRVHTKSAGLVGFRDASGGSLVAGEGITQIGWSEPWTKLGHHGGHLGWLSQSWAKEILAPLIDPSLETDTPK